MLTCTITGKKLLVKRDLSTGARRVQMSSRRKVFTPEEIGNTIQEGNKRLFLERWAPSALAFKNKKTKSSFVFSTVFAVFRFLPKGNGLWSVKTDALIGK